jgi:opacity protein-like surface antigen
MQGLKVLRFGVLVALVAVTVAVLAQAASADPTHAKSSAVITAICGEEQMQFSVNGNGVFTPGHVIGGTAMLVPTAFDLTFSFTPPGGPTESETDTAAKHNQTKGTVTCDIPAALNTFTSPEGTFTISGTVTGFFTPANGK